MKGGESNEAKFLGDASPKMEKSKQQKMLISELLECESIGI